LHAVVVSALCLKSFFVLFFVLNCAQWSATLSFEAYHSAWEAVASTASDTPMQSTGAVTTTPLPLSYPGV
jgi:hypothetical protein